MNKFTKICARFSKPSFKGLNTKEKNFCKAFYKIQECEFFIGKWDRQDKRSGGSWRREKFAFDFLEKYLRATESLIRARGKLGYQDIDEKSLFHSCQQAPGGSF